LKNKIDIERKVSADTWTTLASVYAAIEPFKPARNGSSVSMPDAESIVTIRYLSGVLPSMRVKYGSKYFNILYVIDTGEKHTEMILGVESIMDAAAIGRNIAGDGQYMTLTRMVTGSYNPITGAVASPSNQTWQVYVVMESLKQGDIANADSLVISGNKLAVVSAGVIKPVPGDRLGFYTVISVDTVAPAGIDLLYRCQVGI
jgi:head-tail adaptor